MIRKLNILGSGVFLPPHKVSSSELDQQHGFPDGTVASKTGVQYRHYAQEESASELAAKAIQQALHKAQLQLTDIDCIIAASGTMEQAIPCNAANILAQLDCDTPITAFDINATCLSALVAMDLAASMLHTGQHQHIIIVSSDIASPGLNWQQPETAGLFGDGAAAIILGQAHAEQHSKMLATQFKTYNHTQDLCQIRGGGSLHHPSKILGDYTPYGFFEMQGKKLFKATSKIIDGFCAELFKQAHLTLEDIDWIVPHQASGLALEHLINKLTIDRNKIIHLLKDRGNQIAVSLPSGLHELLHSQQARTGDKILLIGTSAGLSLGGVILQL